VRQATTSSGRTSTAPLADIPSCACLVATSTVVCWWPPTPAVSGQSSQRLRWTNGSLAHSLPRPQVLPA
jgi:hypothetical protein